MADKTSNKKEWQNDTYGIQRGDYGTNSLATLLFVAGRLASPPLYYLLATRHPLSRFNIPPPPAGGSITIMGVTLQRLPFLTALMPGVLSAKHLIWATSMMSERMTVPFALLGVAMDLAYEGTSTLVFTTAGINPLWSERLFYTGMTIFYTGVAIEFLAEIQRIVFKSKPENKGKLCTTGFWAVTRHVNYSANVLFGFGYGLACGGPLYSVATVGMYLSNFVTNAMPSLEAYCEKKYGEQFRRYVEKVPWKLIPFVY